MSLISGETLVVLLVSADPHTRDDIAEVLAAGGDHRLYWVSEPGLAPTRAQDLSPHAIIIDSDLGGADTVSVITQMVARAPTAAVLALIEENAMNQARQAMLAGARAFLTKPLYGPDCLTTLRQVFRQHGEGQRAASPAQKSVDGRVIVFCAPKGGTGRTTLALNTAISMHAATKHPLVVIDADYAAPAVDVALNLHSERTIADLLPRLSRADDELIRSVLVPHVSGLQLLLAPPPAALTSPLSLPQVQQVLGRAKRMFPWVLVDLGLPMDETAFAFLDGADRIVVNVLPEMVGLRNIRLMLEQFHARGYPQEKIWLVLNRCTMRGGVSVADIEKHLGFRISETVPDDQPLATQSVNRGIPMVMSHNRSAVARAYQHLAQQLVTSLSTEPVVEKSSLFQIPLRGLLRKLHPRTNVAGTPEPSR